uniref:Transmembrane protein n=1 Tax=Glossina austeni TaxID=7395 RepID=A0A1A9VB68_GLOAU
MVKRYNNNNKADEENNNNEHKESNITKRFICELYCKSKSSGPDSSERFTTRKNVPNNHLVVAVIAVVAVVTVFAPAPSPSPSPSPSYRDDAVDVVLVVAVILFARVIVK